MITGIGGGGGGGGGGGMLAIMTFDLDLYLQGYSTIILQ